MNRVNELLVPVLLAAAVGCSSSSNGNPQPDAAPDVGADVGTDAGADTAPEPDAACVMPTANPGPCAKEKMEVFTGDYQVVVDKIGIGDNGVGFDLDNADCDGDRTTGVDNLLWPLGALANPSVGESLEEGDIVLPMELFGVDDLVDDPCVNLAFYFGAFAPDRDEDGAKAGGPLNKPEKDCNDTDDKISHKATEVAGNGVDDDCDGLADEAADGTPSSDSSDADGDGQTIAAGDCDDRKDLGAALKKGGVEVCGDGLDNDCNGRADDGCLPWSEGMSYPLDGASVAASNESKLVFRGGAIEGGVLRAGPSVFAITFDVDKASLELNLSHVFVEAKVSKEGDSVKLSDGLLSGVLSARAMDQVGNLIAEFAGGGFGSKDDSLLDAVIGPAGMLLALPSDTEGNRLPDIDVDGDGIERFIDTDADGDTTGVKVDTCIDGDGTEVKDKVDAEGKVIEPCTLAKDKDGNYRFVDGWSITLTLGAAPTKIEGVKQPSTP